MPSVSTVFDTRAASPGFASLTCNGTNIWTAGAFGWKLELLNTISSTPYTILSSDASAFTLTITDGHGTPLSASNSLYTGANAAPQFKFAVKDPVTPANPTIDILLDVALVSNTLGLRRRLVNNTTPYKVTYDNFTFMNLLFAGSPTGANFLAGAANRVFGIWPQVMQIDFGTGSVCLIPNQAGQQARRVLLPSLGGGVCKFYYESDGRFDSANDPQFNVQAAAGQTDDMTVQMVFDDSGRSARQTCKTYFDTWVATNPPTAPIVNWTDRRIITAWYPSGTGQSMGVHYAQLYGLNKNGTTTFSPYPSGSTPPSGDQTARFEKFRTDYLAVTNIVVADAVAIGAQALIVEDIEADRPVWNIGDTVIDPLTGSPITVAANSIFTSSSDVSTWHGQYVGDGSAAVTCTPALGHISPNQPASPGGLTVMKEVFNTITNAGIIPGALIRDDIFAYDAGYPTHTVPAGDPNAIWTPGGVPEQAAQVLIDKITWYKTNIHNGKWVFYVDTTTAIIKLHPSQLEAVAAAHPNCLLFTESTSLEAYRCEGAYVEATAGSANFSTGTSRYIRDIWGRNAAQLIFCDQTSIAANQAALVAAVAAGDILFVHAGGAGNGAVPIYQAAMVRAMATASNGFVLTSAPTILFDANMGGPCTSFAVFNRPGSAGNVLVNVLGLHAAGDFFGIAPGTGMVFKLREGEMQKVTALSDSTATVDCGKAAST
jgi:hypothetical protein